MSTLPVSTRPGDTRAENTGTGNQALHQGSGDQLVSIAGSNSSQYSYHAQTQYNITVHSRLELEYLLRGRQGGFNEEPPRALVIEWLEGQSPLDFLVYHRTLLGQLVLGTGEWVLERQEFRDWRDEKDQLRRVLWMQGILGSGKTMLSTFIVKSLLEQPNNTNNVSAVTYLYLQEGKEPLDLKSILVSLIKQLVQQQKTDVVVALLKEKYLDWCHSRVPPDSSDFEEILKSATSVFKIVYLVVDALDSLTDVELTEQVIRVLKELPENVKVLITSRTGYSEGLKFDQRQELSVVPPKSDIQKYVKSRILKNNFIRQEISKEGGPELEHNIVSHIFDASGGMFLLTKLHMDFVGIQGSPGGIKSALKDLPKNDHATFEASVKQFMDRDKSSGVFLRGLAKHVLTWVIHARRPPTTQEVKESFAVQHSKTELNKNYITGHVDWTSLCAGFVVVDPETQTLCLVHDSVRDYVVRKGIVPRRFDLEMAQVCLKYLMLEDSPSRAGNKKDNGLFEYAASHWVLHFQSGTSLPGCSSADFENVTTMALDFLRSRQKLEASFQTLSHLARTEFGGMTGLHAATFFGLESLAKRLIDEGDVGINAVCSNKQTALHWAVQYERISMVAFLLQTEFVNPNLQDNRGDTPLHMAVVWPVGVNDETVTMLMKSKAQLDIQGSKKQTALSWAIHYGPLSTARILISSMENVDDARTCEGWTPLRQAMFYYDEMPSPDTVLIDLLLEKGADLNTPAAEDGWTPLIHAVPRNQGSIARRLLRREHAPANVDLPNPKTKESALMCAFAQNLPLMADLLIDHGADINEVFPDDSTPLIKAVQGGYKDTVWKLLQKEATIDHQDANGKTALYYAVHKHALRNLDSSLAWLLIMHGAKTLSRDQDDFGIITSITRNGDLSLLWLFYERGLLDNGAVDDKGHTILHHIALTTGAGTASLKLVRFLLSRGVDMNPRDNAGKTPLHHAVFAHNYDMVRALVNGGANIDAVDSRNATPLHHAVVFNVQSGSRRMIKLLVELKASLELEDDNGRTPLMMAAQLAKNEARIEIVECLIELGADFERRNNQNYSAWSYANGPELEKARRLIHAATIAKQQGRRR